MLTAGACCAKAGPGEAANAATRAIAATPEYKAVLFLISLSSNDSDQVSWLLPGTAWRSPGARQVKAAHRHAISSRWQAPPAPRGARAVRRASLQRNWACRVCWTDAISAISLLRIACPNELKSSATMTKEPGPPITLLR